MAWALVATAGVNLAGSFLSSKNSKNAANSAKDAQVQAAQLGVDENRRQFDALQQLMAPYVDAGKGAMGAQQNLIGLNGNDAQAQAIAGLQAGPQYTAMMQAGSDQILGNASATGGLRGGNTQSALGQFGGQMLSQIINQQYQNLGGLTSLGQNSAAGVGNAGMQSARDLSTLFNQQGSAQAGAALARGQANNQWINGLTGTLGQFAGKVF